MGIILRGKNKKNGNLPLNEMAKEMLDHLTWGIKKKYGIYPPLSKEECLMVARILKNKADILENHKESTWFHEVRNISITLYSQEITFKKDADLQWIKKVAAWFEHCGGLIPTPGIQGEE